MGNSKKSQGKRELERTQEKRNDKVRCVILRKFNYLVKITSLTIQMIICRYLYKNKYIHTLFFIAFHNNTIK